LSVTYHLLARLTLNLELEAYNQCVEQYADGVYRFIVKQIKDKDAARDIVQDSFEKMWRRIDSIEASKAKSYLFTTAYHTLVDYTRKQNRKASFSEVNHNQHSHTEISIAVARLRRI
jgi:RNA polymerase sigma factor (sigma-70 family)